MKMFICLSLAFALMRSPRAAPPFLPSPTDRKPPQAVLGLSFFLDT
jgi:hypothetical protein